MNMTILKSSILQQIQITMGSMKEKATLARIQYLVWAAILLISFFGMLKDGAGQSAAVSVIEICYYAVIVYGNIRFLYPRFYEKKRYVFYIIGSILLLVLA